MSEAIPAEPEPVIPFGPLKRAVFERRENRFRARVIDSDGQPVLVHVPNSGRLTELLVPGADVRFSPAGRPDRKTAGDLLLVFHNGHWVCIDSRLPAPFAARTLHRLGGLPAIGDWAFEPRIEGRRLDLYAATDSGPLWVETKSVTLVENGVARFPDAPTERGRHHVELLIRLRRKGDSALLLFVVQRGDASSFSPHTDRDPPFAEAVRAAFEAGVQIRCICGRVDPKGMWLAGELPVEIP